MESPHYRPCTQSDGMAHPIVETQIAAELFTGRMEDLIGNHDSPRIAKLSSSSRVSRRNPWNSHCPSMGWYGFTTIFSWRPAAIGVQTKRLIRWVWWNQDVSIPFPMKDLMWKRTSCVEWQCFCSITISRQIILWLLSVAYIDMLKTHII